MEISPNARSKAFEADKTEPWQLAGSESKHSVTFSTGTAGAAELVRTATLLLMSR
jgi:hypothetical protein